MTVREFMEQLAECHPDDQVAVQGDGWTVPTDDTTPPEPVVERHDPIVAVGQIPGGRPVILIKPGERW